MHPRYAAILFAIIMLISTAPICIAQTQSTDLGQKAAALAKEVVGAPYLWGGKGWDFKDNKFVESTSIKSSYNYYDPYTKSIKVGSGLDCSGLVYWAFNQMSNSPCYYFCLARSRSGYYQQWGTPMKNCFPLPFSQVIPLRGPFPS